MIIKEMSAQISQLKAMNKAQEQKISEMLMNSASAVKQETVNIESAKVSYPQMTI